MKIAFISDIHGNDIALKSCLEKLDFLKVERIYFLGDSIGYLPFSNEVLDLLSANDILSIRGNHEGMLLGFVDKNPGNESVYQLDFVKKDLRRSHIESITLWGIRREIKIGTKNALLIHGSPQSPYLGYVYPDTNLSDLIQLDSDIIVMGHTHYPFIKKIDKKLIINVGSVGMPRDVGNLSSFMVYDTETEEGKIYRTPFLTKELMNRRTKFQIHDSVIKNFKRERGNFIGKII